MDNVKLSEKDRNIDLLKYILEKIINHPSAFTLDTYGIWYDLLSSINPILNKQLFKNLNNGHKLESIAIKTLYDKHCQKCLNCAKNNNKISTKVINNLFSDLIYSVEKNISSLEHCSISTKIHSEKLDTLTYLNTKELITKISNETSFLNTDIDELHKKIINHKKYIEVLQKELETAHNNADIDPLTGLLNRRGLTSNINEIKSSTVCALLIDIDNFKFINDTYGHLFGDNVIKDVSNIFKSKIRKDDLAIRLGSDEFLCVLTNITITQAIKIAESIRKTVNELTFTHNTNTEVIKNISVSIGIVLTSEYTDVYNLISKADDCLYISKNTGRNKITVYNFDL